MEKLLNTLEALNADPESVLDLVQKAQANEKAVPAQSTLSPEDFEFFESKIRPILVENCFECHGPEKQKAGLRLDSAENLLRGSDSGLVVLPGDAEGSLLIKAVRYRDPSLQMPPPGKLSDSVIADLEEWVRRGAPFPSSASTANAPDPQKKSIDLEKGKEFWSFKPLSNPQPPAVSDNTWVRSPIDAFVLAELKKNGIEPAAPADKRTLIRRATFDLTGLAPTPEEVEAFLADDSPEAFSKVVDRQLASPHYGERWGRHWLDVVRYTDSFDSRAAFEQDVGESYRYRDWVVGAFNNDMPYDRFLRYQIAGDVLPPEDSGPAGFNREGIIATGMLAIGNWPGGDADKEKMVTDIVDDQIDVVTRGMLGLTVACARCHDHKFDPITTEDYYGLAGIFFSSHILPGPGQKTEGSPVLRIPLLPPEELAARKANEAREAVLNASLESIQANRRKELALASLPQSATYLAAARAFRNLVRGGTEVSKERFSEETGLIERTFDGWLRFLGFEKSRLLSKPVADIHGKPGIHAWVGEQDASSLTVNTNESEQTFLTIIQPGRSVAVHPSPQNSIAVSWKSPADGAYAVQGRVEDLDNSCGDGIAWNLTLESGGTNRRLCQGAFINGGQELFANAGGAEALNALTMNEGDTLTLSVEPKSSHACDTTLVDLRIVSLVEKERTWDLAGDLMANVHEGNPHSDRFGDPEVWRFLESTENGGSAKSGQLLLAEWEKEIGRIAFEAPGSADLEASVREAAGRLTENLIAFSALDATAQSARSGEPLGVILQDLVSEKGPLVQPFNPGGLSEPELSQWTALNEELAELNAKPKPPLEYANGVQEGGVPDTEHVGVHDVKVHIRGRYDRLGEVVPRRFPTVLTWERPKKIQQGSGRLELADWVAHASNPLTARVLVNRVWQHYFGNGIVRTSGNFGELGERPTHPDLLDWLARDFIEDGWSIKTLHRRILLSSSYQQSSDPSEVALVKDPDNRLFSRQSRWRLEAESLRDAMLQVSGRLDPTLGGPPFRDLSTPRRTLYFKTVRSDRTSFNMLFDAADPTAIVDKRIDSTVAPQALFLLNNPFVLDSAQALATTLVDANVGMSPQDRIQWLYSRLFGRSATEAEIEIGKATVDSKGEEPRDWTPYCQVLLCSNEFVYVD